MLPTPPDHSPPDCCVNANTGYTLPLALVAMLLILAMLRGTHDRALSLVQSWVITREADLLEESVTLAAISAAPSPGRCSPHTVRAESGTTERTFCHEPLALLAASPATQLPAGKLDYGSIFSSAVPCPGSLLTVTRTSFDSPVARRSCAPGSSAVAPLVLLDNIVGENLSIERPAQAAFSIIATPGTFELQSALQVDGDTLVLAGGDIRLGAVIAQQPATVTLLSVQGSVYLQQKVGPLSVVLVGAKELRAPAGTLPLTFPLPPSRALALTAALALDGGGK